jgi:hypothetical protein
MYQSAATALQAWHQLQAQAGAVAQLGYQA